MSRGRLRPGATVRNSLLSSELKQETGQGLWVFCGGGERFFRGRDPFRRSGEYVSASPIP